MSNIVCPISTERVSENIIRKIATLVLIFAIIYFLIPNPFIPFFLAFDFAIRSFSTLNISALGNFSRIWNQKFPPQKTQLTDRAPKRFAAGVGFVFSIMIGFLFILGFVNTSYVLMGILALCAALEAFSSICIGCYVYTLLKLVSISPKMQ